MQRKELAKKRESHDGSKLTVGIAVSQFNADITESMLEGALRVLSEWSVPVHNIHIVRVPGSFEIPLACLRLLKKKKPDAVIALGCIIKGETRHDEYIASTVANGIMRLSLDHNTPISFGIITTNNLAQAKARSRGEHNKGAEAASAALTLALV